MKPRTIIGIIFIVASLLKLATIWDFIHWSWFEQVTEQPWTTYFCIFVVLYVGVNLIIDSYRRDPDQWLQRDFNLNWKFNEARSKYRGSGAGEKQKARM